ncbi:MAG: thiol:disulfide interchange protein, partial [Rhodothermaceae bacterium]|nr:thiol:disulfide interchange protein [Rhodothermaceae bacterium]
MYFRDFFVILTLLVLVPGIALAQSNDEDDTSPYSEAVLISEFDHVVPGSPFTLALKMQMDPGWHSYWQNPGDSGEPTEIEWELPATFSTSPIQWPYPHRIDLGPLRSYGYSDEVVLLTEISPPPDLEPGTELHIQAMAYWLICEEICLPAEEAVSITLPVRSENPSATEHRKAFDTARAQLPKTLENWTFEASSYAGSYVLQVTPPAGEDIDFNGAYFFTSGYEVIDHPAAQPITQEGNTYLIALQQSEYATGAVEHLEGVLVATEGSSWNEHEYVPALSINVPVNAGQYATSPQESSTSVSLIWMLVLAFAGGLLLNLMPCVFPILSIKVLGFAKQG